MTRPNRQIPFPKLSEGLSLLSSNIRDFVADSEALLSAGHDSHAVALAIFAFEELGKYVQLDRARREALVKGENSVSVKDELFHSHPYKENIAKTVVADEVIVLVPAYFDEKYFDPRYSQTTDIPVQPNLRLECVFVDWVNDDWKVGIGTTCDKRRLRAFLKAILDVLNEREDKL